MKVFAVFVLVLAALVPAYADTTQTWDVTTSCDSFFGPCTDPDSINAVFTTQMEFGTYHSIKGNFVLTGFEPVVINISGTFDGMAMTFAPDGANWLLNGAPEDVRFTAGGIEHSLVLDGFFFLDSQFINWSAVPVPEPSIALLSIMGLLGLVFRGRTKRSLI